jgi:hypothetical protein
MDGFKVKLAEYARVLKDQEAIAALRDALEVLYVEAQARVPVGLGAGAGRLQGSMRRMVTDYRPSQGFLQGKVTMMDPAEGQLPYAWMREEGGTIVPRPENRLGLLVWEDLETGEKVFAKRVVQEGSHYMRGSAEAKRKDVKDAMAQMAPRARKAAFGERALG